MSNSSNPLTNFLNRSSATPAPTQSSDRNPKHLQDLRTEYMEEWDRLELAKKEKAQLDAHGYANAAEPIEHLYAQLTAGQSSDKEKKAAAANIRSILAHMDAAARVGNNPA